MKRIITIILALCMLLCVLPMNASAATMVSIFELYVNVPVVGEAPMYRADGPNTSCEVTKVEWFGNFDANGCFMANEKYTVNITTRLFDDMDKYIVYKEGSVRVNKKAAPIISISADKREAVVSYTFSTEIATTSVVKDANFTIAEPVDGEKPSTVITTDRSDIFIVSKPKWTGEFDENGCFMGNKTYSCTFGIKVKDGVDVTIPSSSMERNYYLNGEKLSVGGVQNNGKMMTTNKNFSVALNNKKLDFENIYSEEYADSCNFEAHGQLLVIDSGKLEAGPAQFRLANELAYAGSYSQVTIATGDRIWVTNVTNHHTSPLLETSHPYFPNRKVYISADTFKPIKDLSEEDKAQFNAYVNG